MKCCMFVSAIGALFGGIETGLVFALKVRYSLPSPRKPKLISIVRSREGQTLAGNLYGRHLSSPPIGRCSTPLLGHLHPSNRTRDLIHLRRHRCSRRYLLLSFRLYVLSLSPSNLFQKLMSSLPTQTRYPRNGHLRL